MPPNSSCFMLPENWLLSLYLDEPTIIFLVFILLYCVPENGWMLKAGVIIELVSCLPSLRLRAPCCLLSLVWKLLNHYFILFSTVFYFFNVRGIDVGPAAFWPKKKVLTLPFHDMTRTNFTSTYPSWFLYYFIKHVF